MHDKLRKRQNHFVPFKSNFCLDWYYIILSQAGRTGYRSVAPHFCKAKPAIKTISAKKSVAYAPIAQW